MPSVCGAACGQASGKQGKAAQALTSGPAIKKYAGMAEPAMFHGEKADTFRMSAREASH